MLLLAAGLLALTVGCGDAGLTAPQLADDDAVDTPVGTDVVMLPDALQADTVDTNDVADAEVGDVLEPDADASDIEADVDEEDFAGDEDIVDDDMVTGVDPRDTVSPPDDTGTTAIIVDDMWFRTLHWNIAGGKENDCKTAGIQRAVMRYVRNTNGALDFVSLNEVCRAQFDAIKEALRQHWGKGPNASFAAFQGSGGSRVGSAIFSRQNIDQVTRKAVGEDQWGTRYLLCGRQVDRRIRVCTLHLSPGDTKARKQLDRALTQLESWWDNRKETVVIAGDFNIQPDDPGFNKMYSKWANTPNNPNNHGAYRELDDNDPGNCRGYGERTQPWTTGGACNEGRKIDLIFIRGNRIVEGDYGADSLDIPNDCSGVCSDHRAVRGWAHIRFRED